MFHTSYFKIPHTRSLTKFHLCNQPTWAYQLTKIHHYLSSTCLLGNLLSLTRYNCKLLCNCLHTYLIFILYPQTRVTIFTSEHPSKIATLEPINAKRLWQIGQLLIGAPKTFWQHVDHYLPFHNQPHLPGSTSKTRDNLAAPSFLLK